MVILPKVRCPGCGKLMPEIKVREVPPANRYSECLRRCAKCRIGATNAKNPAKVKFIHATVLPETPPQEQPPKP